MKLRRFTSDGVAAVRETLPKIEETGDLSLAEALVENRDLTEDIPELSSVDLDPDRVFPTTYAFCEYFHSLMKDHKPLSYRTDVGFWTWLAMVYVKQLARVDDNVVRFGESALILYEVTDHRTIYRHKLAYPFQLFCLYADDTTKCEFLLQSRLNSLSDLYVQIASRQSMVQNGAIMGALRDLYFDTKAKCLKKGAGGKDAGSPRRFVSVVDQLSMTRDFFADEDSVELYNALPKEFDRFKSFH